MDLARYLPDRLRAPYLQARTRLQTAIWLWPAVATVLGPALALWLIAADPELPFDLPFLDGDAARAAITTVISATVAATSLVVTGTIIALQLATGQYSPRLLRDALADGGIKAVLTVFVGSVCYGLTLTPRLGGESLPRVAVVIGVVLGFLNVVLLVFFLHRLVQRLRLESIIGRVVDETADSIRSLTTADEDVDPDVPDRAVQIRAERSGYVQGASLERLAAVAERYGVDVHLRPRIGSFLVAGTVIAYAWPSGGGDEAIEDEDMHADLTSSIDRAVALGVDRTVPGDPAYGIRHLVDIGLRAVSPGINDPTTAVQCIDHTTSLLVELARNPRSDGVVAEGGSRAVVDRPHFENQLDLAQVQLLHYGGQDPWVLEALFRQLRDLLEASLDDDRARLVQRQYRTLEEHVDRLECPDHELRIIEAARAQVEDLLEGRNATLDDTTAG